MGNRIKSGFIDRYLVADGTRSKHRERPERYSLGFSALVILAVTLLGWAAIGYGVMKLVQLARAFSA